MPSMRPYPVFLLVEGKHCIIIGGGLVACRKASDLLECGAIVTVVAEIPSPEIEHLEIEGRIAVHRRRFEPEDVQGAFLVFAATDDNCVNADISEICQKKGILVNAVDDPGCSDFISGAIAQRGPLRIAVSTSGCSPKIAARIRRELEERYDAAFGDYVSFAGELRDYINQQENLHKHRDNALSWIASEEAYSIYIHSGKEKVWEEIRKMLFSS
jgi:precorrin-2 dehydrogenase / sirohydrochlorin ferrochelatase